MAYLYKSKDTGIYNARIKGLKNQKIASKSITLMTKDLIVAEERLGAVNKVEQKIKDRFYSKDEIYSMFNWLRESNAEKKLMADYKSEVNKVVNDFSYIYIINAKGTNNYKVGKANCTQERATQLQVGSWRKLIIMYSFKLNKDYVHMIEHSIHKTLSPYICEAKNEWFCLTKKQLEYLTGILKGYVKFYSSSLSQSKEVELKEEVDDIIIAPSSQVSIFEDEPTPVDKNREYNDKRKGWYEWGKRAEKAGIPRLPSNRPSSNTIETWKQSIEAIENAIG